LPLAFSKPVLVVFILQLFLSAACISTANAGSISQMNSIQAHCYNKGVQSSVLMSDSATHSDPHQTMPACSHCDSPDIGLSNIAPITADMIPVLLAVIALPAMPTLLLSDAANMLDAAAPQHSYSLLYQTSQRILI